MVAVIDEGVEAHPDLPSNRLVIVNGSDLFPPGDNDPSPEGNEAHGMACAGIIEDTKAHDLDKPSAYLFCSTDDGYSNSKNLK